MSKLESMLRRLVSSPLHRLDESDSAPAGPGVFLLSDSDQITSYYIESCQTLRVGLGNLVRGGSRQNAKPQRGPGRPNFESSSGLKSKLAEHLGIGEAKVSQYLKDHCVVRWIQLDDDAPHLAHFAIGVLRAPLNLDGGFGPKIGLNTSPDWYVGLPIGSSWTPFSPRIAPLD